MVSRFYSFYELSVKIVTSQCGDILKVIIYCKNVFVGMVKSGEATRISR